MHLENEIWEEANPSHKTLKLFLVLRHFFIVLCKILLVSYDSFSLFDTRWQ